MQTREKQLIWHSYVKSLRKLQFAIDSTGKAEERAESFMHVLH